MSKNNETLVITGANGNLGSYFAEKFAEQNKNLILFIHNRKDRIFSLVERFPQQTRIAKTDLNDFRQTQAILNEIITETNWQPVSLIHTASLRSSDFQSLRNSEGDFWEKVIRTNIMGTYNILKAILPFFQRNKYGKIVLFGSNVSRIGLANGSAYAASKAAIANLCRSVAMEEAHNNILINTISPGPVKIDDSEFSEKYRRFREKYYQNELRQIPLKRLATFDDIFGLCEFLISRKNSYITGEEFFITGGKL